MTVQTALKIKLAEEMPFFRKEINLADSQAEGKAHSLHYAVALPERLTPDLSAHFIKLYSQNEDLVLDPFASSGENVLEALLLGRRVFAAETDPFIAQITAAKMYPADITEVALALPMIDLRRPVELGAYLQYFAPFYDVATYRELVNLRRYCTSHENVKTARFISMIALGLLHGQGAGYFSVYTSPQVSISPNEQLALNAQRSQEPDYRAVMPRILRRAAAVLRDGIPSVLRKSAADSMVTVSDPRNLIDLRADSVDFVLTTLPLPGHKAYGQEMWLRRWFLGLPVESPKCEYESVSKWLEYINEFLLELARVTCGGRRAVLKLDEIRFKGCPSTLDDLLIKMVSKQLNRYWETEGEYDILQAKPTLKNCLRPRENTKAGKNSVALVLRRR